jgi:hypothetical protein
MKEMQNEQYPSDRYWNKRQRNIFFNLIGGDFSG